MRKGDRDGERTMTRREKKERKQARKRSRWREKKTEMKRYQERGYLGDSDRGGERDRDLEIKWRSWICKAESEDEKDKPRY